MTKGICLIIIKDQKNGFDITNLVQEIQWKGRKGSAARSLQANILEEENYQHIGINIEEGHQCLFYYNGSELFRGIIMKTTQSDKKTMTFLAYDNGIYLANNKDTFVYTNKTASDVFRDICIRFGLPMGEVTKCTYKIPELTKPKTTPFDAITDALSLDFKATGIRHYLSSSKGTLSLLTRRENLLQWVIETGQNIISYNYLKSIENIKTRIKMLSDEETVLAESINSKLERKIGIFQEIEKSKETLSKPQIKALCDRILAEKSTIERALTIEAIGIPEVISGIGVFIIIKPLGISRTFYVDEDSHIFKDHRHTMNLKLNDANDIFLSDSMEDKKYKVGDIVQFHGGYHYISSNATNPTGSQCSAGLAKITISALGAKHPWHLIHIDNQSRVYGWVDEGSFSDKGKRGNG